MERIGRRCFLDLLESRLGCLERWGYFRSRKDCEYNFFDKFWGEVGCWVRMSKGVWGVELEKLFRYRDFVLFLGCYDLVEFGYVRRNFFLGLKVSLRKEKRCRFIFFRVKVIILFDRKYYRWLVS